MANETAAVLTLPVQGLGLSRLVAAVIRRPNITREAAAKPSEVKETFVAVAAIPVAFSGPFVAVPVRRRPTKLGKGRHAAFDDVAKVLVACAGRADGPLQVSLVEPQLLVGPCQVPALGPVDGFMVDNPSAADALAPS